MYNICDSFEAPMLRLISIFLLISTTSLSQPLSFKWSDKVPTKGLVNFSGIKGSQFFTSQNTDEKTVLLRTFDADLKIVQEETLAVDGKNEDYLMSFVSDSFFVGVKAITPGKKATILTFTKYNLFQKTEPITTVVSEMKGGYKGFVFAYYSQDRSKILITNFAFKASTQTTERDFIVVETKTAGILYSGTMSSVGSNDDIGVSNEGLAWFSVTQSYREDGKRFGKFKARQRTIFYNATGISNDFTIQLDGKYTPGLEIIQGTGSNLYLTGFAYEDGADSRNLSKGELYFYRMNAVNGRLIDSVFSPFDGLYPEGKVKLDDRLPYSIRSIYPSNTGGYIVVAEQYQFIIGQYSNAQKFHDIAVLRLSKNFEFEAAMRIPKRQFDVDNPSFISTIINDTLYLLYNDHLENLEAAPNDIRYPANKQEKNGLFLVTIDENLKPTKKLLYRYDSGEPMPNILQSYKLTDRKFALPAQAQWGVLRVGE